MKVATSLPVNNPSSEATKLITEWLADGAIGHVREVHNWSSRPFWPQGIDRPAEAQPIPEGLDWNMWLGPAPERPFNQRLSAVRLAWLVRFRLRLVRRHGLLQFRRRVQNSGADAARRRRGLLQRIAMTRPSRRLPSCIWIIPRARDRPPVRMSWYDGGLRPPRPAGLRGEDQHYFQAGEDNEGILYVGDKGFILAGFNGNNPRVYPESKKYQAAGAAAARRTGRATWPSISGWRHARAADRSPLANFEIQSPVTEAFLLGLPGAAVPGRADRSGIRPRCGSPVRRS